MADALCGPSNALQNFQKQSSVDRTLQQDRLVNRRVQAESFRSDQARNAGILDPEFEAFQAGHMPMLEHDPLQHGRGFGGAPPPQAQFAPQSAVAGWAADFQKLNISQPPIQHLPQLRSGGNVGWHQEFQRQQQHNHAMTQSQTFAAPFASTGLQRPMGYMPSSSYQQPLAESQWKGKERWPVESEVDQAAFDKQFEMFASEALQRDVETESKSAEIGQDVQLGEEAKQINADHVEVLEQIPEEVEPLISQEPEQLQQLDEMLDKPTEQLMDEPIDDGGLAEPAGRLLEHVADNTTEKFQNSQFLDLMRRLRDRETVLKGEEFVDTHRASQPQQSSAPSASAGMSSTNQYHPSVIIPPEEQDSDLGRDVKMTGALPPMDELGWSETDRPLPLDPSFRHRHLVDDF